MSPPQRSCNIVMPLSHRDGEVTATNEYGANTEIDEASSGEEPRNERFRIETRRARSLDSPSRIRRHVELDYEQSNDLSAKQREFLYAC